MKSSGLLYLMSGLTALPGAAIFVPLGTDSSFAVLAGTTVTSTGATLISGDIGVWPGTAVTGFPSGVQTDGGMYIGDAVAKQAAADLASAYTFAADEPCGTVLSGSNLGGLTLTPGVYCFSSSAQLDGTLTLDALGFANAVFIFQIGRTLITGTGSSVLLTDGAVGSDVFWQVGTSATLGTASAFEGDILGGASITFDTGASIGCGRALTEGAVTLDANNVSINSAGCALSMNAAPEPWTFGLAGFALVTLIVCRRAGQ
jgi:type VI secretion system secreted protein VgrG